MASTAAPATAKINVAITEETKKSECYHSGMKTMGLWMFLTSFFLLWTFLYVAFQVFGPGFVQCDPCGRPVDQCGPRQVDNGRAFIAAFVLNIIIMLILALVAAAVR